MHVELKLEIVSVVDCVSGISISAECKALRMCVEALSEQCNQVQAGNCPQNQTHGKQACDRHAEAAPFGCLQVLASSACVKSGEAACVLNSTERSHFNGASPVPLRAIVASP